MCLETLFPIEVTAGLTFVLVWSILRAHRTTGEKGFKLIAWGLAVYMGFLAGVHYLTLIVLVLAAYMGFLGDVEALSPFTLLLMGSSFARYWLPGPGWIVEAMLPVSAACVWVLCLWRGFGSLVRNGHWSASAEEAICPHPRCMKSVPPDGSRCPSCGQEYSVEYLFLEEHG